IAEFDDSFLLQVNGDFHVLSPGDFDAVRLRLGGGDDQFEYYVETQTAGVSRTVEVDLGRGDDFGAVYAFGPLVDSSFSFDVDGGLGADLLRVGLSGATLERS
ncbi:hypothetical protein, partial [Paludisphaera soli]|uniref:hypothetical protein n=1 Tax=Paludisphaera soli TaxID=2712865 RepID=UPI0013ED4A30